MVEQLRRVVAARFEVTRDRLSDAVKESLAVMGQIVVPQDGPVLRPQRFTAEWRLKHISPLWEAVDYQLEGFVRIRVQRYGSVAQFALARFGAERDAGRARFKV